MQVVAKSWYQQLLPYKSKLWKDLHFDFKRMLRNFVNYAVEKKIGPIADKKRADGWINPEIKILHDEIFGKMLEQEKIGWQWWNAQGKNTEREEKFWENMRDAMCVTLDEDSHYLLRFFYMIELLHENYPKFRIEMHKQRAYWNWEKLSQDMKAHDEMMKAMRVREKEVDTNGK